MSDQKVSKLIDAVKDLEDQVTINTNHIERLREMVIDSHDEQEPPEDLRGSTIKNYKEACGKCPHQKFTATLTATTMGQSSAPYTYYCELGTTPDNPENCPTNRCENCYYKQALRELLDK